MGNPRDLTQTQIDNIQIDEGIAFLDYGETTQRKLAPLRGGCEFNGKTVLRDIEYDGRRGKTKGMQAIESQEASIKASTLASSQENIKLALQNLKVTGSGDNMTISNPTDNGVVGAENYLKNMTVFGRKIGGRWKKITICNPMNEGDLSMKFVQKSENEHGLTMYAHFDPLDSEKSLYTIEDVPDAPADPPADPPAGP